MSKMYFVSYNFIGKDDVWGFGNDFLTCNKCINEEAIRAMEEDIKKKGNLKHVVIFNFIEVQDE